MTDHFDRRRFLQRGALTGLTGALALSGVGAGAGEAQGEGKNGLYEERYRPRFHFTPARGFINDPNGLVFYKGEYHLFFQHTDDIRRPLHKKQWGHAVSTDLIHWRQLPPAILAEDGYGAFSGSSAVDWNNTTCFQTGAEPPIVAAYTSWGRGQFLAYSNDRCRTFHPYEGNPVLTHPDDGRRSWPLSPRDPKILWWEKGGHWILLMYQKIDEMQGFGIYTSPDMKTWTFASHVPGFYVCPDLFQLPLDGDPNDLRWVILDWEQYAIGHFDGRSFSPQTAVRKLDEASGRGDHVGLGASANQTWKTGEPGDGRIVQIAWLRGGPYPNMPFSQQMTFPTQLSLRSFPEGIRLCREPIEEIKTLYERRHDVGTIELRPNGENVLAHVGAELVDLQADFRLPEKGETEHLTLNVRGVLIEYDAADRTLSCFGRARTIEPIDRRLSLRVLIDRTSLEIYLDGGRLVFTFYHFFDPAIRDFALSVGGGPIRLDELSIRELRSAWKPADARAS